MKGKQTQTKPRHKESNTFKFQTFSDRISNIKVDVFHRIKHVNEEDSEKETYFQQALEKWSLLNCSEGFAELQKEIKNVETLPQILKQKDSIVSVLQKHLDAKNLLNLQPVLELVVALAKDLRQDFYSSYSGFHARLISLLDIHDSDVLEWTFHCFAHLFKFLWRYLVTDLQNIFESLMPLLSSSKPYYINNFAAESFAFVARKVKDQKKFLFLALKLLKKFPDGIEGCGRLLFEVVKGVSGRFHSSAEGTLSVYLESFNDSGISFKVFTRVITVAYSHIITNIHADHCEVLWKTLQNALSNTLSKSRSDQNSDAIDFILNIIQMGVENRSGGLLKDPESLANILIQIIQPASEHRTSSIDYSSQILALLLLSHRVNLTQELASKIVVSAMSFLKESSLLLFMELVLEYSGFDGLVLPRLLKYCNSHPTDVTLPLLTKLIILRSPPITSGHELINWQPYQLNFPTEGKTNCLSYGEELLHDLSSQCPGSLISQINKICSYLIILPHIGKLDHNQFLKTLKELANNLCLFLSRDCASCCENCSLDTSDSNLVNKTLMILTFLVEDIIKLRSDCPSKLCTPDIFLEGVLKYCQSEEYISALRVLDFYITSDELNCVAEFASKIREKIWLNLMSPYHKVRLLSVHILFELEKGCENGTSLSLQILESSWLTELSPASVSDYREKLKHIQKIEVVCCLARADHPKEIAQPPMALLLGQLFINFKLIWEPISKTLASLARAFPLDIFWSLFYSQVSRISFLIREQSPPFKLRDIFSTDYLSELYSGLNDFNDRPDYINYRIILWNAMKEFPDLCEMKNRDVVSEFFNFVQEEYFVKNSELASTWNIKHISNDSGSKACETEDDNTLLESTADDADKPDIDSMEVDVPSDDVSLINGGKSDNGKIEMEENPEQDEFDDLLNEDDNLDDLPEDLEPETPIYKWANKSLLVHLELLAKFRAPKSVSREPELHKLYLEFLSHRQADIQKASLDCLLSYKDKFLLPYRQNLYNLIDDKTFRQEINMFRISCESDVVKPDHRVDLIPIVLRIVYVKMFSGSVKGKNSKYLKRSAVIRFLGGCTPEELNSYFNMAFPLFIKQVQDDALEMVESIMSSVDVEKTVPPRRLQSLITLLRILVVHTGGLLDPKSLGRLLRLVLSHAACAVGALSQRQHVHSTYVKTLRGIRSVAIDIIIWFFDKFQAYPWTANEIDSIFTVFVWPWIDKLQTDSAKAPTPLLKLFAIWSQNPRYFILLGHWKEENGRRISPLSALMDLWLVKPHKSVNTIITETVERLLTLIDSSESGIEIRLTQSPFLKSFKFPDKAFSGLNFGSKLMLHHATSVMEKLKQKLSEGSNITGKELEIMSRITELVMLMEQSEEESSDRDTNLSENLYSMLLPILLKKASSPEHVTIALLTSLKNLAMIIPSPGQHIRSLVPLFARINGPVSRKLLISLVINSHKRGGSDCDLNYQIVEDINSYNAKWLDQPDFDRRLDSFKKIESLMKTNEISFDLGLVIIRTCFHFICTEKDLSLKDSSSQCLRKLCPFMVKQFQESEIKLRHLLLDQTILNIIQEGIRNKQEDFVRSESIVLLGIMVRECPEAHPILRDLTILANKDELEVDFFENMQHLQQHRRLRAMMKFCEAVKEYKRIPKPRAMTQFILPIISHYLCNERYIGQPTAIDCAIQSVTAICRLLPWHQYLGVLKYYLEKMQKKNEFQKQLVRINTSILNAFHFDLSSATHEPVEMEVDAGKSNGEEKPTTDQEQLNEDNANAKEEDSKDLNDEEDIDINNELTEETLNENEDESMETDETGNLISVIDIVTKLPRSSAARVVKTIQIHLIQKLTRSLSQRNPQDSCHKSNRRISLEDSDEKDMIRIPLAIPVVKLLQKLPPHFLKYNISGILMKVISYLKSRVEEVRKVARKTLQEIAISLGPQYLSHLVQEMTPLLTRGFHVHVLAFTIHSILSALKPHFKLGDIDPAISHIIAVCHMDLFGDCSEEKEVVKIIGKVLEARSSKSFSSFNIMGQFVSERYLLGLVIPLKEELSQTLSAKKVDKVWECLRQIVLGLGENQFLSEESLILFAYGTASESIASLLPAKEAQLDPKLKEWQSRRAPDSYLIPKEPKRQKSAEMKACIRTNSHLLIECGLRLLYVLLKRDRLKSTVFLSHLDPFVSLLADCLKSQHVKVSTMAIQCLCWVFKYDLPSLRVHIHDIVESCFAILHKYAASGLSKGDNFQLVFVTFKAMGILVKEVKYCELSQEQLRILLMYCEQDLDDHSRQATAFSLLKAVLVGRVESPELPEIMQKVSAISVTASLESVRSQARQVVHHYLMEYPLGKKVNNLLSFYYQNLDYEQQQGRESVLEMIRTIVETFPMNKLEDECGVIFINLCARLVNDPAPECRKTVAGIITSILNKVSKGSRDKLFDIAELWLKQNKESTRRLAAQVIGLFVSTEKEFFSSRLNDVLPLLVDQFLNNNNRPGKFVLLNTNQCDTIVDDEAGENGERMRDHLLFQVLQVLGKIITHIPDALVNSNYSNHWTAIIGHAHSLLCHAHEWVRLGAVQLIGLTLSTVTPSDLAYSISHPLEGENSNPGVSYLFSYEPRAIIRSMTLDLLAQLTPDNHLNDKFILQIMKLLVYIAEVLKELKSCQNSLQEEDENEEKEESLSLHWLVKRIRNVINAEIVHAPHSKSVRTMCFNWMAAVAVKLDVASVSTIGYHLVAPIARELALSDESDPLREVAKEASQYIRSKLGHDEYTRLMSLASNKMDVKKAQRKTERAQMAVTDPVRAAKRKIQRQQKKKLLKKRKVDYSRTNKFVKKPKKEINLEGL